MALLRKLLSRRLLHSLLTLHPNTPHSLTTPHFPHRPITSSRQTQHPIDPKPQTNQNKKPLHTLFMEAVGLSEKTESQSEEESEIENSELNKKLKQLEEEVKSFKEKAKGVPKEEEKTKKGVRRSLHDIFTNQPDSVSRQKEKEVKLREPMVVKELSPDMEMFVQHLYENGYFKDANFVKGKERFDLSWFESFFARGYIKFAAQKFARDNQEIAKKDKRELYNFDEELRVKFRHLAELIGHGNQNTGYVTGTRTVYSNQNMIRVWVYIMG